ncbi:uncharacterized protein LOC115111117 isoform X2 [Oncorhynchus nerka]|uniref:uncharacterized protein LOC115111117 isoform X2 n=1 Tax=Oncorhynchus nerka TaxID=8023 RepID=UPI0031B8A828
MCCSPTRPATPSLLSWMSMGRGSLSCRRSYRRANWSSRGDTAEESSSRGTCRPRHSRQRSSTLRALPGSERTQRVPRQRCVDLEGELTETPPQRPREAWAEEQTQKFQAMVSSLKSQHGCVSQQLQDRSAEVQRLQRSLAELHGTRNGVGERDIRPAGPAGPCQRGAPQRHPQEGAWSYRDRGPEKVLLSGSATLSLLRRDKHSLSFGSESRGYCLCWRSVLSADLAALTL